MACKGNYNVQSFDLDRSVNLKSKQTASSYSSKFLDITNVATPDPKSDNSVTLGNTKGDATLIGNYNFEGSDLDCGVNPQLKESKDNYSSTFLEDTQVPTLAPKGDSAVTLGNTEGDATLTGNFNFEASDLDHGVKPQPKESKDGYSSTFLEDTEVPTPMPKGKSPIILKNTKGGKILTGNFNFEGSELDRGLKNKPRDMEKGYSSSFMDKTKVEMPNPIGESAVTLKNTEGKEKKLGNFYFEGSDFG